MSQKQVLIVEDDKDLSQMYTLAFENAGYVVSVAYDGVEGITQAVQLNPDIILLDIMMPQMNGYEVLRGLRNNTALKSVVVVCSNLGQNKNKDQALGLGADHFIEKVNYTPREVVKEVEAFLETNYHKQKELHRAQSGDSKGKKVLIVEDDDDYAELVSLAFLPHGYETLRCSDGLSGLTQAVVSQPDLIVLDLRLPIMNGFDFLVGASGDTDLTAPIFVLSVTDDSLDKQKVLDLGAKKFISKLDLLPPQIVEEIIDAIELS